MTKGQQAIVVARAVFESNTELSRAEREMKAKQYGISPSRIAYALVILEFATDLADEVLAGSGPGADVRGGGEGERAASQERREDFTTGGKVLPSLIVRPRKLLAPRAARCPTSPTKSCQAYP